MTLKKCPDCGHQHDSADIVCPYCKHSYSEKKYICNNCGAYLQPTDKICYVCGQVVEEITAQQAAPPEIPEENTSAKPLEKAVPIEAHPSYDNAPVEDISSYSGKKKITYNPDVPEEKEDTAPWKSGKKKSKKPLIIGIIAVLLVILIAGGVGFCYHKGYFTKDRVQKSDGKITVYFEKPFANKNLITGDGEVYQWTGDVNINYTLNGKTYQKACNMTDEYDNIWFREIPAKATDVYFSERDLEVVRTAVVNNPQDRYIYYVTDILFNVDIQLPIEGCPLNNYDEDSVNYMTIPSETESQTEETQDSTDEETQLGTEPATEPTTSEKAYTITIPEQWTDGYYVVENGNCTTYYDKYNYTNYDCGQFFSVYVYNTNDTSYSEMNVKKVLPTPDGLNKIVVVSPTDVQFYEGDDAAIESYIRMEQYVDQIVASIDVK